MEKEKMLDQMLLQLHEQYAQNNNANLSSVIGIITAVIAILGFYGYVFVYSSLEFAPNLGELRMDESYTIDVLVLITMVTFMVIGILQYICLYQGSHQRYEQFITYAIRCECKHLSTEDNDLNAKFERIFHKRYHPFEKGNAGEEDSCSRFMCAFLCPKRNMQSIVQGLFGELVGIFSYVLWCVGIATTVKCLCAIYVKGPISSISIINILILVGIVALVNFVIAMEAISLSNRYQKLCKYYKRYLPNED